MADSGYGSEANYEEIIENRQKEALIPYGMYRKEQRKKYREKQKSYVKEKLSDKNTSSIYGKRKIDVEPVFGNLKANLGFTRFSVRGKENISIETGLALMAVNLRKITAVYEEKMINIQKESVRI